MTKVVDPTEQEESTEENTTCEEEILHKGLRSGS
jgi:hypothetical protein